MFYPEYHANDPYAAYRRGYYFHGTSYIQLPPHSEDSSDSLVFGAENTVSVWIRPKTTDGTIFAKQDSSDETIYYELVLVAGAPTVNFYGYNLSSYAMVSSTSSNTVDDTQWYTIGYSISLDTNAD